MKKVFIPFLIFLSLSVAYLWNNKETSYSVVVEAPVEKVWAYVSKSDHAKDWSVYFSHISALPGIKDGEIGSVRRCFRQADERGPTWDEEVVEVISEKYRQIRTYNLQNFPEKNASVVQFRVHQRFEVLSPTQTKLTFATELIGPWTWDVIQEGLAARSETLRIFEKNLINIKSHIEGRPSVYPYEPQI